MFNKMNMNRSNGMPTSAPPSFEPKKGQGTKVNAAPSSQGAPFSGFPGGQQGGPTTKAIDQGAIVPCLFRFVYIWPTNGRGFWAYLVFAGRRSVAGWRYDRGRWRYFGMDLRRIEEFYCN